MYKNLPSQKVLVFFIILYLNLLVCFFFLFSSPFFKRKKINVELHFDLNASRLSWSQNFINAKACDQYEIMNASLEPALPIFISVHNDWSKQIVAIDTET